VTHLRQLMLDELQRRNYSQSTVRSYIFAVEDFASTFTVRRNGLARTISASTRRICFASVSFLPEPSKAAPRRCGFFSSRRFAGHIFPITFHSQAPERLPTILDQQEVARLIDSASNLMHRTMMMMLYATGLRRAEMCHLKVSDIDSKRMVIHVREGKGGRDRDVLLTPKLLETLREYCVG